jgi:hypothetical protein
MQSAQANRSPTVVDTTGLNPADVSAELASLYFWPTTFGEDFALASAAQAMFSTANALAIVAANTMLLFTALLLPG